VNRLFITCRHHATLAESFCLADRPDATSYEARGNHSRLQKWFDTHATCGGGFDHFTIAYSQQKDGDMPSAKPVADAVHVALNS
jgi:hypothetical protein